MQNDLGLKENTQVVIKTHTLYTKGGVDNNVQPAQHKRQGSNSNYNGVGRPEEPARTLYLTCL